ncbi:MAG TPA: PH domain-containing protein [Flavobacterium sp.]|nr:PH domain-containing protein [Flavobacterium sp.]
MEADFSAPRRQSAAGIAIMFADTFQSVIRAIWAPLLVILYRLEPEKYIIVGLSFFGTVLLVGIIAFLKYRNFTFFLDEEKQEFILSRGVLNKSRINIQLSKIQQVNITQSLIQKLAGVYSLDIDTAGTDKKEISIRAVDRHLAQVLKERLLDSDGSGEAVTGGSGQLLGEDKAEAVTFIKISHATLLKVGITSNYGRTVALLLTFAVTLYQTFEDAVNAFKIDEASLGSVFEKSRGFFSAALLACILLGLVLAINIIRTFARHFNFEMARQKQSLAVSSGLFAKKNTLINPEKVQITSCSQNFFQKKLRILDMHMKQASSGEAGERQKHGSSVEVPGCSHAERDEILKIIFGKLPEKGISLKPNRRFLIFKVLFRIMLPALICALLLSSAAVENLEFYLPLFFVYLILAGTMLYFGYKNYRLYASPDFIIKKHGAWDVEHEIIEPHKIQAITARQFFWHKKADVGHLVLHTAAGDSHFKFGNFAEIKKLADYWLCQVEDSNKNWM